MFIDCGESVAVQVYGNFTWKGAPCKAIVTVFSTLTVSLQFDNQVDVAVTDW